MESGPSVWLILLTVGAAVRRPDIRRDTHPKPIARREGCHGRRHAAGVPPRRQRRVLRPLLRDTAGAKAAHPWSVHVVRLPHDIEGPLRQRAAAHPPSSSAAEATICGKHRYSGLGQ